ncbi:MAG: DUF2913 family protein [Pantoea sp.]|uniref:DUF2913 family protein n=1 Tax=Pantoea sp. TaxID=69393 RepID=UPI0029119F8B|nr:DUF2913 family protein [Pantoea sp.]MDU7840396.1 DUF2913 family protein [Pantoea sp.]
MSLTEKSGHLAWCALIALALARKDGTVCSAAQENLFLTRWLASAQKQRRFSRDVAPDIDWLLKQGRQYGVKAQLAGKLGYLWQSCAGTLTEQNALSRLTFAMEAAKDMGWIYRLLTDREWSGRHAVNLNPGLNGVYVSQTSLAAAFDAEGRQVKPLMARLTGSVAGLEQLLDRCGWKLVAERNDDCKNLITLAAENNG